MAGWLAGCGGVYLEAAVPEFGEGGTHNQSMECLESRDKQDNKC